MNTDKDLELAEDVVKKAAERTKDEGDMDTIYAAMITDLQNYVTSSIEREETNLEGLKKTVDNKDYFVSFYRKELFEELRDRFFNREYATEPEKRINNIRMYVEDKAFRFESYLKMRNHAIKTEEDVEMFEKNDVCTNILSQYTTKPSSKEEVENRDDVSGNGKSTKDRFSSVLDMLDEEDKKDQEENKAKKELEEKINNIPLSEKIEMLYDKCIKNAIAKDSEEEGLVYTYITDIYNPETTELDEQNLYFNLMFIDSLQKFNVIDWNFDTDFDNLNGTEYKLSSESCEDIMSKDISDERKYLEVLEKNSKFALYSTMISSIGSNFNRDNLTKRDLKMKNLFVDEKDETSSMEQLLIHAIKKKSEAGDIVMITPDMKDLVDIDKKNVEELNSDEHIQLLGTWKERWMLQVETKSFDIIKNVKNAIFFIKKGNRYNINPEKPLVHFHVIDNPLLPKPIIKTYYNMSMKFFMANTTIMFVDDLED